MTCAPSFPAVVWEILTLTAGQTTTQTVKSPPEPQGLSHILFQPFGDNLNAFGRALLTALRVDNSFPLGGRYLDGLLGSPEASVHLTAVNAFFAGGRVLARPLVFPTRVRPVVEYSLEAGGPLDLGVALAVAPIAEVRIAGETGATVADAARVPPSLIAFSAMIPAGAEDHVVRVFSQVPSGRVRALALGADTPDDVIVTVRLGEAEPVENAPLALVNALMAEGDLPRSVPLATRDAVDLVVTNRSQAAQRVSIFFEVA